MSCRSGLRVPFSGQLRGSLLVVAAAVLWSTGGLGIKNLSMFPLATAGWRSVFALPLLTACGGLRRVGPSSFRQPAIVLTSLAYAFTLCLFVSATRLTTAANAILLQYSSPVWVILLSFPILGERPRRRDYLVAAGCLAGLALFFMDRLTPQGIFGIILAMITGVTMACLVVGLRYQGLQGEKSSALTSVLLGNILCIVMCSPWMLPACPAMAARDWLILVALGSLQLALPYVLFSTGLECVTAVRATLIGLVEPVLNPIWVALWNGEVPGSWALLGGSVILGCLVLDAATSIDN